MCPWINNHVRNIPGELGEHNFLLFSRHATLPQIYVLLSVSLSQLSWEEPIQKSLTKTLLSDRNYICTPIFFQLSKLDVTYIKLVGWKLYPVIPITCITPNILLTSLMMLWESSPTCDPRNSGGFVLRKFQTLVVADSTLVLVGIGSADSFGSSHSTPKTT